MLIRSSIVERMPVLVINQTNNTNNEEQEESSSLNGNFNTQEEPVVYTEKLIKIFFLLNFLGGFI